MRFGFICIFVLLLNGNCIVKSEGKKRRISNTAQDGEDVVRYNNAEELKTQISDISSKKIALDSEISDRELQQLAASELSLKRAVLRAELEYGEYSSETATALHALGRNLYKQGKVKEVEGLSMKIVKIHEKIDGPEHVNTGNALSNVGSVAFKLGNKRRCELIMKRALHIFLNVFGDKSKEVLVHIGRMMTFQIKGADTSRGLSYEDYLEYMDEEDL